jgi:hypothetical protein
MSRSLRAVLATATAAGLLVGGISLASYATTRHEAGSGSGSGAGAKSQPKTLVFKVGSKGQQFNGGSARLYNGKVPKGTYEISMSGIVLDRAAPATGDAIACLVADKRTLSYILNHPGSLRGSQRLYALLGQNQLDGGEQIGLIDQTNPAAKVDRRKIVFGCTFNGTGPFEVARPLQFTLTPVKVDNQKAGARFQLPITKVRAFVNALR